jgi:hypothetical protein
VLSRNKRSTRAKNTTRRDVSSASRSTSTTAVGSQIPVPSSSATTLEDMSTNLEVETVLRDSASLELVFQQAVDGDVDGENDDDDGDNEEDEEEDEDEGRANVQMRATPWVGWTSSFSIPAARVAGRPKLLFSNCTRCVECQTSDSVSFSLILAVSSGYLGHFVMGSCQTT